MCVALVGKAPSLPQKSRDKPLIFDVDSLRLLGSRETAYPAPVKILPWVSWMLDGLAIRGRSLYTDRHKLR